MHEAKKQKCASSLLITFIAHTLRHGPTWYSGPEEQDGGQGEEHQVPEPGDCSSSSSGGGGGRHDDVYDEEGVEGVAPGEGNRGLAVVLTFL